MNNASLISEREPGLSCWCILESTCGRGVPGADARLHVDTAGGPREKFTDKQSCLPVFPAKTERKKIQIIHFKEFIKRPSKKQINKTTRQISKGIASLVL